LNRGETSIDLSESDSAIFPQIEPTEGTAIERTNAQFRTTTASSSSVSIVGPEQEDGTADAGDTPERQNVRCSDSLESIIPNTRIDEQYTDHKEYITPRK
jgi:hypothetical protein